MKEKKEGYWWLYWLPNMVRYLLWPGLELVWSAYPIIRTSIYFAVGFLLTPAIRLAWNFLWPSRPIDTLEALVVLLAGVGLWAFLTKTSAGNGILGTAMALVILAACLVWLLATALPALAIYAATCLGGKKEPGKTAYKLCFGPLEWADRRFFLAQRTGN